jgi:hypothetical protein
MQAMAYCSGSQPGVCVSIGVREWLTGGMQFQKALERNSQMNKGYTILIWGYAEGYNFDLGVREYQKVENLLSSGNGRWLMIKRLWVRIYTGWMKLLHSYFIKLHENNGFQIGHIKNENK